MGYAFYTDIEYKVEFFIKVLCAVYKGQMNDQVEIIFEYTSMVRNIDRGYLRVVDLRFGYESIEHADQFSLCVCLLHCDFD